MRISYWSSDVCSSVLRYGDCDGQGDDRVRLLCGFLHCDALGFPPVREALPPLLHASTQGAGAEWLRATVTQIVAEVDDPRAGSRSMMERLTEILFIELLRHRIVFSAPATEGWLAARAAPALGNCLEWEEGRVG